MFKIAYRNLIKQKRTLLINLSGLSVGMTVSLLIMVWVINELNYDNYHENLIRYTVSPIIFKYLPAKPGYGNPRHYPIPD